MTTGKEKQPTLIVMDGQIIESPIEPKRLDPEVEKLIDEHFWEMV